MKSTTVTYHINTEKTGSIAGDIVTDLVDREDLTMDEIIAVWMNINIIMETFLESEGITINQVVKTRL